MVVAVIVVVVAVVAGFRVSGVGGVVVFLVVVAGRRTGIPFGAGTLFGAAKQ